MLKIHWDFILTVLLALVIFKLLDTLFLDAAFEKIGDLVEGE